MEKRQCIRKAGIDCPYNNCTHRASTTDSFYIHIGNKHNVLHKLMSDRKDQRTPKSPPLMLTYASAIQPQPPNLQMEKINLRFTFDGTNIMLRISKPNDEEQDKDEKFRAFKETVEKKFGNLANKTYKMTFDTFEQNTEGQKTWFKTNISEYDDLLIILDYLNILNSSKLVR